MSIHNQNQQPSPEGITTDELIRNLEDLLRNINSGVTRDDFGEWLNATTAYLKTNKLTPEGYNIYATNISGDIEASSGRTDFTNLLGLEAAAELLMDSRLLHQDRTKNGSPLYPYPFVKAELISGAELRRASTNRSINGNFELSIIAADKGIDAEGNSIIVNESALFRIYFNSDTGAAEITLFKEFLPAGLEERITIYLQSDHNGDIQTFSYSGMRTVKKPGDIHGTDYMFTSDPNYQYPPELPAEFTPTILNIEETNQLILGKVRAGMTLIRATLAGNTSGMVHA